MDYLDRASAPLSDAEWSKIDLSVVSSARDILVARKFLNLLGPLGPGAYDVPFSVYTGKTSVGIDMAGESDTTIIAASSRKSVPLPLLYADFKISWRDIETDRKTGLPIDASAAAIAAVTVASQEDDLIFNGNKALGIEGLFTATGRLSTKISKWDEPGTGLADVVKAVNALASASHYGPYALVVSPVLYGKLVRVYANTGLLELDHIKALISGGIYYSNVIKGDKAVVLELGSKNFDLAIGQDFTVGYLGAEKMNHLFRVLETAALLIRRPCAICTIE
ncbi:MAG: family 1 encapsulin nanocompartment shell protein [Acidaminococcaceae bacterium]